MDNSLIGGLGFTLTHKKTIFINELLNKNKKRKPNLKKMNFTLIHKATTTTNNLIRYLLFRELQK